MHHKFVGTLTVAALVAAGSLSFENGLILVSKRAFAMQKACEMVESTMAAVLGLEDAKVEEICAGIAEIVVPANYNCPGQLVISGSMAGIEEAVRRCTEAGASKALVLQVGGAFHSPLMQPVKDELQAAILATQIATPVCPVYQNVVAAAITDAMQIKENLIAQLTGPVKWTQCVEAMIADGATHFTECGPGKVLQGLVLKINKEVTAESVN